MRITITVPKQVNETNAARTGARSDKYIGQQTLLYAKRGMAAQFGGFTTYEANGGWVDSEGKLIEEPVTVVESYSDADVRTIEKYARAMALTVMRSMVQDAVMYTIDNRAHFVYIELEDGQ